mmetsp:Transcript_50817/g.58275  ORF Transcript_50817/g.58275 Transcript_50817/m.58275 type:complete len:130 (-) Transcript_50817:906-1295(-)|eukprot:CAMPEP_0114991176 /NCGR_PEP_ID=MMETSP0216-20121206/11214_1 /TAXON_ID=223996 /ORGANISM="Protocruzia adherens, Strain Boccale" /LENGTH=129 /DNA_ID=CAMNT_0002354449 /DNA_START=111 /DNA_END=500 /DNA_ORIENTATION=-
MILHYLTLGRKLRQNGHLAQQARRLEEERLNWESKAREELDNYDEKLRSDFAQEDKKTAVVKQSYDAGLSKTEMSHLKDVVDEVHDEREKQTSLKRKRMEKLASRKDKLAEIQRRRKKQKCLESSEDEN